MSYLPTIINPPVMFTPSLSSGGAGYFTYNSATRSGVYEKIGRSITFFINVDYTAVDGGTGSVVFTGLPGALSIGSFPIPVLAYGVTTGGAQLYGIVGTTGTLTVYLGGGTATDPALTGSALSSTGGFKIAGTYLSLT